MGLLYHMVFLFLIFWAPSLSIFHRRWPFCVPINSMQVFQFLYILTCTLIIIWFFNNIHRNRWEVIAYYNYKFNLHFSDNQCHWPFFFSCICWHFVYLLWGYLLWSIFNWIVSFCLFFLFVCLFLLFSSNSLYTLGVNLLSDIWFI